MSGYVGAIDQGTTSTRFILFDRDGRVVAIDQREHEQINPRAGWVEHDAAGDLAADPRGDRRGSRRAGGRGGGHRGDRASPTSARRPWCGTARAGEPIHNAIVWQDTRTEATRAASWRATEGPDRLRDARRPAAVDLLLRAQDGAGCSIRSPGARERAESGELAFGTIDSWLLWNLTGGAARRRPPDRRDERQPHDADGPREPRLARAEPRADGHPAGDAAGDPLLERGLRRDRAHGGRRARRSPGSSATSRRRCSGRRASRAGEAKNTYGTGSFLLLNTGEAIVAFGEPADDASPTGSGRARATYALEGSIAVTGALVQWLRDRLGLISSAAEVEELARTRGGQRRASTSCPRSRDCSLRTGAMTRAG